jgi:protein disulfide isomerase family A protein 3
VASAEKPLVVIKSAKGKFVMSEEFSVENLESFLKAYEAGTLEPYLKSEPVPDSNDGPVKVAVAKNFQSLVTDSAKDVLIEFYAPWCGHCNTLAPKYEELGQKLAGEEVEIVKMDATANEVPAGYDVRGFPTLYWLPKDTKKPEVYHSGREVKDFIKFIAEKATTELKQFDRQGKEKKTEL